MNEISRKIKLLRKSKGLSQKELANLIGISQPTLFNIEHGSTDNITIKVGISISKALDIPFLELFEIESNLAELIKLKIRAITAVEQFVSNNIFFKSMELDESDPEQQKEFEEYKNQLSSFKKGIYQNFINTGLFDGSELKALLRTLNDKDVSSEELIAKFERIDQSKNKK